MGVPIRKLHRDFKINMSIPTFTQLIECYEKSQDPETVQAITTTILASLFPIWLKEDSKIVQSQPKNWKYIGQFPLGAWIQNTVNINNENN